METILSKFLEYSLSLALLMFGILYFAKRLEKKDEKIHELHREFVELIKETNETMRLSCAEMIQKLDNI